MTPDALAAGIKTAAKLAEARGQKLVGVQLRHGHITGLCEDKPRRASGTEQAQAVAPWASDPPPRRVTRGIQEVLL